MTLAPLLIFVGGGLGSVARWGVSLWAERTCPTPFPFATLGVNVLGSFAIGLFAALTGPDGRWPATADGRLFFMTGVCGGFTTFSAFSWQTLLLIRQEQWWSAAANILLSVSLCLFAVWLGHLAGAALNPPKPQ